MLLSVRADAKTKKGEKIGVLTGVMYLAPAKQSGVADVCKYATDGCRIACLFTAGRAGFTPSINEARIRRTKLFYGDRSAFWSQLIKEIKALERKAKREGLRPAVRLNGTSDMPWERVPVIVDGVKLASNIMELFGSVDFYDYTKYPLSERALLPTNYDLTFSHNERDGFAATSRSVRHGRRVAMVFDTKRGAALPATWRGLTVIDGDVTDVRFNDAPGVIVGLRAKGDAKGDTSGFVVKA
jgi:hypothetical protein